MSYPALSMWALGTLIKNPLATGIAGFLLLTPGGRDLLKIAVTETLRFNYRVGSRIGTEIIAPRAREAWVVARPVVTNPAIQIAAAAVAGKTISNQLIAVQGGDVSGGWGAAPSRHLVGGRPWWE